MIDSFSFGRISINSKIFVKDVLIFPDRVQDNWWRKEGHLLQLADIQSAVEEAAPEIVVVGQGKFGVMKVHNEVREYFKTKNMRLYADKSDKAAAVFNRFISEGKTVLGAFHLTC
jgi:hypothetical protein